MSKVFNLLSIGVQYALSFEWPDFDLKCLVAIMPKGEPLKFKDSVWDFFISYTSSNCNSRFRPDDSNWVIIMELERMVVKKSFSRKIDHQVKQHEA